MICAVVTVVIAAKMPLFCPSFFSEPLYFRFTSSAKRNSSVRVVAEAPSNLVHQIFVYIDESPVDKIPHKCTVEDESLCRLY